MYTRCVARTHISDLAFVTDDVAKMFKNAIYYHRLRGSASTVLTATGQVNGRFRILTFRRIETHEPTATKFRTFDYVRKKTP